MYLGRDSGTDVALRNEILAIHSPLEMKLCQAQPQKTQSSVSFPRKQTLRWRFAFRRLNEE